MNETRSSTAPSFMVVVAASLWGLFWLPLRAFESAGLEAGWATLAQFIAPAVLLTPLALCRVSRGRATGLGEIWTGLLVGSAFVLYFESLLLTEVVRALLLFYITPIWGTLLEVTFMRRRLSGVRAIALLLGLSGFCVILGFETGVPKPRNLGDVMALVAGVTFAIGTMRVRQRTQVPVFEQLFSFFIYGGLLAGLLVLLPIDELGAPPSVPVMTVLAPWLVLMAAAFLIPVMWVLLWGSKALNPGRLGILLQMEAVVGIGSAALFAGEPFGFREVSGTVLVVSAALIDTLNQHQTH